MAAEGRRRNLGRGLSALLGDEDGGGGEAARGLKTLPITFLHPSPYQPRHRMNDERLQELAQSIADKGVLQPLLVRRDPELADSYEIIAGERRWRAAQLAKVHEVPVIVRELEDREALEIALIENLQREDLSPLDEADGFRRLKDEFSYTQAELATALGKSRSHVANTLRLLNLPDAVKEMIEASSLTAGHARALLNAGDPVALARTVVRRGLNVRQTEKLVQAETRPARARKPAGRDPDTVALERDLSNLLGLKVGIHFRGGAGSLTIHYQSLEQLDEVLHRLSRGATGSPGPLPPDRGENDDMPDDLAEDLAGDLTVDLAEDLPEAFPTEAPNDEVTPLDGGTAGEMDEAAPSDDSLGAALEDESWPAGPMEDANGEEDMPAFPPEDPEDKV